jgi:hypothetical protein
LEPATPTCPSHLTLSGYERAASGHDDTKQGRRATKFSPTSNCADLMTLPGYERADGACYRPHTGSCYLEQAIHLETVRHGIRALAFWLRLVCAGYLDLAVSLGLYHSGSFSPTWPLAPACFYLDLALQYSTQKEFLLPRSNIKHREGSSGTRIAQATRGQVSHRIVQALALDS